MKTHPLFALVFLSVTLSGCMTSSRRQDSGVAIEVTPSTTDTIAATGPSTPPSSAPSPLVEPAALDEKPLNVWKDSEVVSVDMDAYVNERGELVAPSRKWVVRKAGGWNMEAARHPERAYIPAENVATVPQGASGYTPIVAPASTFSEFPDHAEKNGAVALAGIKNVRVTGFMNQADRSKAQAMAKAGEVLVFDKTLGFLLVPQAVFLQTPIAIEGANGVAGPRAASPEMPKRRETNTGADEDIGQGKQ